MTSGISAVQARISEIHSMFGAPASISSSASSAANASASMTGTTAAGTDGASNPSFADALAKLQTLPGATAPTSTGSTASEDQVVAEARKYLGIPYLWGGTDPAKGLDCSGFTQRAYKNLGIDIPRVSADQARGGRQVASLADARPGDLVFYDNSSSRPGVDHVAMYIGDGKIMEAARPGTLVRVSDVGSPIAIRRYLPEAPNAKVATLGAVPATVPLAATSALTGATTAGSGLSGVPYANLFTEAAARHGVPAALLAAVAKTESAFNASAVSSAGAQGLMQFMPATAQGMGVNPLDPASAVDGAARYLSSHLREFGSIDLALAAYNAGPGTVRKYNGVPPYAETQNYVTRVKDAWETYR